MIITGGSLSESKEALKLARQYSMYATVGCHPTRSSEFDKFEGGPKNYLIALEEVIQNHLEGQGRVVAVGECGLGRCGLTLCTWDSRKQSKIMIDCISHLPMCKRNISVSQVIYKYVCRTTDPETKSCT